MRNCFDILHVSEDISIDGAKQAYIALVKRWHPDQFGSDPEKQQIAHDKLKEINVAYRDLVGLLKHRPAQPAIQPKYRGADPEVVEKPSLFKRMGAFFKNDPGRRIFPNVVPPQRDERGASDGGPPSRESAHNDTTTTDFHQVLNRAIRKQPRRAAGARRTADSRERPCGRRCARNKADAGFRPAGAGRRTRGDSVERITPVGRVRKIGD